MAVQTEVIKYRAHDRCRATAQQKKQHDGSLDLGSSREHELISFRSRLQWGTAQVIASECEKLLLRKHEHQQIISDGGRRCGCCPPATLLFLLDRDAPEQYCLNLEMLVQFPVAMAQQTNTGEQRKAGAGSPIALVNAGSMEAVHASVMLAPPHAEQVVAWLPGALPLTRSANSNAATINSEEQQAEGAHARLPLRQAEVCTALLGQTLSSTHLSLYVSVVLRSSRCQP